MVVVQKIAPYRLVVYNSKAQVLLILFRSHEVFVVTPALNLKTGFHKKCRR